MKSILSGMRRTVAAMTSTPLSSAGIGHAPVFDREWDAQRQFPEVADPAGYRAARIWNCKYRTLKPVAAFTGLEELAIMSIPDPDLTFLQGLGSLTYLRLLHLPKVTDLAPLAHLQNLRTLLIETPPSWDSGSKRLTVASFEPLGELRSLENITLIGIRTPEQSLRPLERCSNLRTAWFGHLPKDEIARFHAATGCIGAYSPPPKLIRV
ncbi:hypothetical protein SAMN05428997_109102 [Bosea sp. CRIB-10]|nr:hypothetical protein SAMN05428997_109102 [Bosea sp. CRIB-10]